MKALLICPADRPGVVRLAEACPLAVLPVLGQSLIEYWLQHLALRGARQVSILATDRPDQVRAVVGDGARWGLQLQLLPQNRELTVAEARGQYRGSDDTLWLASPDDVVLMKHLPGLPEIDLFESYASWFAALQAWMPRAVTPERIGQVEVRPGVWVGLHSRVATTAQLRAPCWLGENAFVGPGAVIGPGAILEDRVFVEPGARVIRSAIAPHTFVGQLTLVENSLACGGTLINWKTNSSLRVPDAFLLCSLDERNSEPKPAALPGRALALMAMVVTAPLMLEPVFKLIFCAESVFRRRAGVRPGRNARSLRQDTFTYYELAGWSSRLRRWPQLWSIVRGDMAWVGNRPLQPHEAASLTNDFERLWLAAPAGLISLSDAEGCPEGLGAEACAHASFFAVRASRRLRWSIFRRVVRRTASLWMSRLRLVCGLFRPQRRSDSILRKVFPTQMNYEN